MDFYKGVLRPIAFRFDPEFAHHFAMNAIRTGLINVKPVEDAKLSQTLMGSHFVNPIGLAAGFDKNGLAIDHWHRLGFGFAEIGTVTYHAQPGNPRPRLFRLKQEQALINRMGFNNEGALVVSRRALGAHSMIPLGINIGKSKITDPADAATEYGDTAALFSNAGDYLVINVSSPNTPGLRLLQAPEEVKKIVQHVRESSPKRRLFLKLAPDLADEDLDELSDLCLELSLTGIIATNTTTARGMLEFDPNESGGLSGRPLRDMANACLARIARRTQGKLILIGVGGIETGDDVYEKIRLGAHLVQVYTGWVYAGPTFCRQLNLRLLDLLYRDHYNTLEAARGTLL